MKAIDRADWLGKLGGFHEIGIRLTAAEKAILEKAMGICKEASEKYQAAVLRADPEADNFSDDDSWGWAEIYLREALGS